MEDGPGTAQVEIVAEGRARVEALTFPESIPQAGPLSLAPTPSSLSLFPELGSSPPLLCLFSDITDLKNIFS